jgi:hypothetical protein
MVARDYPEPAKLSGPRTFARARGLRRDSGVLASIGMGAMVGGQLVSPIVGAIGAAAFACTGAWTIARRRGAAMKLTIDNDGFTLATAGTDRYVAWRDAAYRVRARGRRLPSLRLVGPMGEPASRRLDIAVDEFGGLDASWIVAMIHARGQPRFDPFTIDDRSIHHDRDQDRRLVVALAEAHVVVDYAIAVYRPGRPRPDLVAPVGDVHDLWRFVDELRAREVPVEIRLDVPREMNELLPRLAALPRATLVRRPRP